MSEEEIRGADLCVGCGRKLLLVICEQCRSERQLSAIAPMIPVSTLRSRKLPSALLLYVAFRNSDDWVSTSGVADNGQLITSTWFE
jgi:hypothetical protein